MSKTLIIGIVVVVVGIFALGGFLLWQQVGLKPFSPTPVQQTPPPFAPSPQPQAEVLDTSDWQTYRNEEHGFEVKYPEKWSVNEGAEAPLLFNNENGEKFMSISFANRAVIGVSSCGAYPQDKRCEVLETADARFMIDWGLDKEAVAETDINADVAMFVTLYQFNTPAANLFKQILATFRFVE